MVNRADMSAKSVTFALPGKKVAVTSDKTAVKRLRELSILTNDKRQRADLRITKYNNDIESCQLHMKALAVEKQFYDNNIRELRENIATEVSLRKEYLRGIAIEKNRQNGIMMQKRKELFKLQKQCENEAENIRRLKRSINDETVQRNNFLRRISEYKQSKEPRQRKMSARDAPQRKISEKLLPSWRSFNDST